jgi:hypothetical protein
MRGVVTEIFVSAKIAWLKCCELVCLLVVTAKAEVICNGVPILCLGYLIKGPLDHEKEAGLTTAFR